MATRKTKDKPSALKSAASDLVEAARSLGKAIASKAEETKADATAALARARKDVTAGSSKARRKIVASVDRTETRIEQAAANARKSVQRTIGKVEKKAKDVKVQAERTLARAEKASSQRVAEASGAIAKEVRGVKVAVKKKAGAVAKSVKSATVKAKTQAASTSAAAARKAAGHLLGDRQRRGQARRLDAEQIYQPGHAVLGRPLDDEVGPGFARAAELGPDAGIGRLQRAIGQPRPIATDGVGEGRGARRVDTVVFGAAFGERDPLHVGAEAHLSAEIERDMHAQPGLVRHRVDQPREGGPPRTGKVVAARPVRLRQHHRRQAFEA